MVYRYKYLLTIYVYTYLHTYSVKCIRSLTCKKNFLRFRIYIRAYIYIYYMFHTYWWINVNNNRFRAETSSKSLPANTNHGYAPEPNEQA